jgi:hypothetical protein
MPHWGVSFFRSRLTVLWSFQRRGSAQLETVWGPRVPGDKESSALARSSQACSLALLQCFVCSSWTFVVVFAGRVD